MLKVIGNNQWGSWSSQNLGTKKHSQDTKSDEVQVQVALKTHLSISRPGQRSALRWLSLAVGGDDVLPQLINYDLALQILLRQYSQALQQ